MVPNEKKRITITISKSMHMQLTFMSYDTKATKSQIIEALCLCYFWNNNKLLKRIEENDKKRK